MEQHPNLLQMPAKWLPRGWASTRVFLAKRTLSPSIAAKQVGVNASVGWGSCVENPIAPIRYTDILGLLRKPHPNFLYG